MTDHPRFENGVKILEDCYARTHGGGLVALLLRLADRWEQHRKAARLRERSGLPQKSSLLSSR